MALTKKNKQIIKDVAKYLSVAEMAVRFGVSESEIYSYLKVIKVKPLVTSGNIDLHQKKIALNKINNGADKEKTNVIVSVKQIIKENWKFLALLLIGVFLLYINSLSGNFVSDDYATITQNQNVANFRYNFANENNWIVFLNNIIAFFFGTTSPIPFHILSLFLYLIFIVVAFIFLAMIFDKSIARYSILIFSVLPVHVEAVSWISGKPYLVFSTFILIGMIFFIKFTNDFKIRNLIFLAFFFLMAFLTDKPRPMSLLLLIILYLAYKNLWFIFKKYKVLLITLVILALGAVVWMWPYVITRINSVNLGYNGAEGIFYNPLFQYPTAVSKYLQLMLVPVDLTLYHTMYVIPVWLNWSIIITYLVSLIYFFFKNKNLFFALAFIFLATAPSMAPVKVSWLVAERYVFLGSLGFVLFLVLAFKPLGDKFKYLSTIVFASLILMYGIRTFERNNDWRTNHNLWVNTVQVSPNSHNAWNNIGDDYDKLGQLENAVKGFTRSTMVKTNYADAYHNRANIFYKAGRYDLARDSYETALYYGPNLYQSYYSLLQIDLNEKKYDLALNHIEKLQKVKANDIQVYYISAVVYANMGQNDKAIQILEQIVKIAPQFTQASELLKQIKK